MEKMSYFGPEMYSCFVDDDSADVDGEGSNHRPPPGPDIRAMEKNLKPTLKATLRKLVGDDDSDGLEEALEAEKGALPKPAYKSKNKKKSSANGSKEEDEFMILARRILNYASAVDAVECCKLLLTSQGFPRVFVDAVDEVDQRTALHVASQNHSKRCVEILLKHGANVAVKSKHTAVPLEEALLSSKIHVEWDFLTPAAQIVEKIREKDLAALRTLEPKCKDLLVPVAFKLAKALKLVPLIALLIVAKASFVVNSVAKKIEGEDDSVGTLVDLLLGKALSYSSTFSLDKLSMVGKPISADGSSAGWSGEVNYLMKRASWDRDGSLDSKGRKNSGDWESAFETRRDSSEWDEGTTEIKHRKDINEWEEINSKYRSNGCEGDGSNSDGKFRRPCSGGDMDRKGIRAIDDICAGAGEDVEINCKIARKLLECVLLFSPRLSAHPQSPCLAPLLRAAQANDEGLLSLLLDAGAPINETDSDGNTALHWALRQATPVNKRSVNRRLVKRLLDAGANVLVGNKLGATPVHTSAGHGHFEALQLILEKEAGGVNVMAATKETPLHYSVKNNHILCTALLLTHGANRNVSSLRSQKPFHLAPSPEMRALLTLDEATLRQQPQETLMQTLTNLGQQQSMFQYSEAHAGAMPLGFAPSADHSMHPHLKSQFPFPPGMSSASASQPLSFAQSLSLPAMSDSFGQSQLMSRSSALFPPGMSELRSQSLPTSQDSSLTWNSQWLNAQSIAQKQAMNGLELSDLCDGDSANGKANNVNLPAYKTVFCRFFGTADGCGYGTKCHFAHSEEEVRAGQLHLKTLAEKNDALGAKGFPFNMDPTDQAVKNFKTKLCMHHEKLGSCPHGSKCKFAHGASELRPMPLSFGLTGVRTGLRPSTASSITSSGSANDDGGDAGARKIFVGGLAHFIQADELWEFFETEFGKVQDAIVIVGNDEDGVARSRGFGFVTFVDQKDADEAVRRHFFPVRGKKVEVKRAMARMDSPSADETGKIASAFSSGISSPAAPESPALPSSMPGVRLFNDGMQLPPSPALGPPPGWGQPPSLHFDVAQDGVHNPHLVQAKTQPSHGVLPSAMPPYPPSQPPPQSVMPPYAPSQPFLQGAMPPYPPSQALPHGTMPYPPEHNFSLVHAGQNLPQTNNNLYMQESQFHKSEPYPPPSITTNENGIQMAPRNVNVRSQEEPNSFTAPKPYPEHSSYPVYSSSPVKPSTPSSLSSVSNDIAANSSKSAQPFSYFDINNAQPYYSSSQSTSTVQAPGSNQSNDGDDEEELSELLKLLKGPSSAPSQSNTETSTNTYKTQAPSSTLSSQGTTSLERGAQHVLASQNGANDPKPLYSQNAQHMPHGGLTSSLLNYGGLSTPQLPDGFREIPQPPAALYRESGQSSNSTGYHSPQKSATGYNPRLPVGPQVLGDGKLSNTQESTAPRAATTTDGPRSITMSDLLPGFGKSQQSAQLYDSGPYGVYPPRR